MDLRARHKGGVSNKERRGRVAKGRPGRKRGAPNRCVRRRELYSGSRLEPLIDRCHVGKIRRIAAIRFVRMQRYIEASKMHHFSRAVCKSNALGDAHE